MSASWLRSLPKNDDGHPHVVALCESLRDASRTRVVLGQALDGTRAAGGTAELVDLLTVDLPALDPDAPTPADAALSDTVAEPAARSGASTTGSL